MELFGEKLKLQLMPPSTSDFSEKISFILNSTFVHPVVDSWLVREVVNRIVIVPHICHRDHKMRGQKYNHRSKNKNYTTPCPIHGM